MKYVPSVTTITAPTIIDFSANYLINKTCTVRYDKNLASKERIVSNLSQGFRPAMPFAVNLGLKVILG